MPASITAPLILPRDPHASVHAGPRENVWQTLSAFVRCGPGSTPVRRLGASEPTSFLSSAGEDRHPPVEPWRVRWRSPAWSSVRRAFLLERDQSLHVQIRPLALMGPGRRASPCEPARVWFYLAYRTCVARFGPLYCRLERRRGRSQGEDARHHLTLCVARR